MVCISLKAFPLKRPRIRNSMENNLIGEDDKFCKHGRNEKNLNKETKKGSFGCDYNTSNKVVFGHGHDGIAKSLKS